MARERIRNWVVLRVENKVIESDFIPAYFYSGVGL